MEPGRPHAVTSMTAQPLVRSFASEASHGSAVLRAIDRHHRRSPPRTGAGGWPPDRKHGAVFRRRRERPPARAVFPARGGGDGLLRAKRSPRAEPRKGGGGLFHAVSR